MALDLGQVKFIGSGLNRPECAVAHSSGLIITPNWTGQGGVSVISPGGEVHAILMTSADDGVDTPIRPNGIALEDGGTILVAHMGAEHGGIYRLWPDGHVEVATNRVGNAQIPPTNFVTRDKQNRLWITVSTTMIPRADDYRPDAASGFIAIHDDQGTRIAADGLGYTNECLLSDDGTVLYVNETFARRLTGFDIDGDRLTNKRTIASFGAGVFPDGLAAATDGSIFITSIVSNQVLRVFPDGAVEKVLIDADGKHVDWVEQAFQSCAMGRPHLDNVKSKVLKNISNLAFGGEDLKTAYLGCLLADQIAYFESPVAGCAPIHWTCDLGPLAKYVET